MHRSVVIALFVAGSLGASQALAADPEAAACIASSDTGQRDRDEGRLRAARNELRACAQSTCPSLVRGDCATWLSDVDARLPTLLVRARDESGNEVFDVALSLDGEELVDHLDGRLIAVDPGQHVLRFRRADGSTAEKTTTFREGEKNRTMDVVLRRGPAATVERAAKPDGRSLVLPIVLGSVAVIAGGAFAILASGATTDAHDLRRTCAPRCAGAEVDDVRTKLVLANVSLGVGVVALGAAAYFLFTGRRSSATAALEAPLAFF